MPNETSGDKSGIKWIVGVLISLLAAGGGIVALLSYFHPPRPVPVDPEIQSVTGTWSYTMRSSVSGKTYQGFIRLTQDGTGVAGQMDDPGGNTSATDGIAGTYSQGELKLSRDTGKNTAQEYRLDGSGQRLAGTFRNVGDYPDSGTIEISRK